MPHADGILKGQIVPVLAAGENGGWHETLHITGLSVLFSLENKTRKETQAISLFSKNNKCIFLK